MSLASEYAHQYAWRSWDRIFGALPQIEGRTVLDLGCGIGDLAAALAARGARVTGIDGNEDLLKVARARGLVDATFVRDDLQAINLPDASADGIWCSFAAAYFPDLTGTLASWKRLLRPGGWIVLTEVDDLFGHEPVTSRTRALLDAYARDARQSGQYDVHVGRRLAACLEQAGYAVRQAFEVDDAEFSFRGPAGPDLLEAWRRRFDRMTLLRRFCAADFDYVREDFLAGLAAAGHRSHCRVCCVIARLVRD